MVQVESRRTKLRTRAGNEKWGPKSGLVTGGRRLCPAAPRTPGHREILILPFKE